jgi:hypothetical protein
VSEILNTNYLSVNSFQFDVARLPTVSFFVQSLTLPGVSFAPATVNNPFSPIRFSGDQPQFEPLRVTFFIDEAMQSYTELFKWWQGLGFPNSYSQYAALKNSGGPAAKEGLYTDLTVALLDSSDKPVKTIQYTNAFPISIGAIDFTFQNPDSNYATTTVLFNYDTFDFV